MQAGLLFLVGVPPAFWNPPTLRAYKILCKESVDKGNYREAKRRARIGMYKRMYRFIEKEKGECLVRVGETSFFLLLIILFYVNSI